MAIEITWLGQAGFLLDTGTTRIMLDPFLSEHPRRLYPPPALDLLGDRLDWLLVSHEHLDHLDVGLLPTYAERFAELRLVLPTPIASQAEGLIAADRVVTVQPGDQLELAPGLVAHVLPSYHGVSMQDAYSDGSQGRPGQVRFVGFILAGAGPTLYFAGDTVVNDELLSWLEGRGVEVALLPINGRDFFREEAGLVGNMNFREAVFLARRIGASVLVPYHWDLFEGNTEQPGRAVDEAVGEGASLHVLTLARYAPFRLA